MTLQDKLANVQATGSRLSEAIGVVSAAKTDLDAKSSALDAARAALMQSDSEFVAALTVAIDARFALIAALDEAMVVAAPAPEQPDAPVDVVELKM